MKTLVLLLFSLFSFAQTEVDLSAMVSDVLLGDEIDIVVECTNNPINEFVSKDIDFNGSKVILNNAILTVNGDVQFGGAFLGYCQSTICINGTIFNTDPPDPGGNPFDSREINRDYNVCIELPEGEVIGYKALLGLLQQRPLSVVKYTLNNNILTVENIDKVVVYNLLGQKLIEGKNMVDLSNLKDNFLIVKTNLGTFKLIKQ